MKKVRGYRRYVESIEDSIKIDSQLDLDTLKSVQYFNFQFEDWYGSKIGLKGKGRKLILESLLKIHYDWEIKLKALNIEYYLAIWLYDPRLELSEIVCGIDSKIEYYNNEAFLASNNRNDFNLKKIGLFSRELSYFKWNRKVDLEPTYEWEINWPRDKYESDKDFFSQQRFYKRLRENAYRVIENEDGKIYFRQTGDVWIGMK